MRTEHLVGIGAGLLVTLAGFLFLGFASSVSAISLAAQTSYIGGIEVGSGSGPPPEGHEDRVNNPYDLEISQHWPSPVERWLRVIGLFAVALIGGATAARVGSPVRAWRGAAAAALAVIFLLPWLEVRPAPSGSCIVPLLAVPLVFLAAAIGGVGGFLVRRFANVGA